jgi:hypothetical protein
MVEESLEPAYQELSQPIRRASSRNFGSDCRLAKDGSRVSSIRSGLCRTAARSAAPGGYPNQRTSMAAIGQADDYA